jgi:hypothetical protein
MESDDVLRRYTSLPALIDILVRRRITLLSYRSWIDSNDRRALQIYQQTLHYGFVGAMCLTRSAETFHHWQIFAPGDAGVCIVFDKRAFQSAFHDRPHLLAGPVEYVQLNQIGELNAQDIHRLPFIKRYGFRDEREYRLLGYTVEERPTLSVEIQPKLIRYVIMSPFAHPDLVATTTRALRSINGWQQLPVRHSSLTDNQTWQVALERYADRHGTIYGPWIESRIEFEPDGPSDH